LIKKGAIKRTVLDICTVFQDVVIFLIMLTLYLECRWVSFSDYVYVQIMFMFRLCFKYVAKCTILSRVECRVTCMTRCSLVAQDAWAESLFLAKTMLQQQPHSLLVELSCGMVCRCQ
jgi:hypothetical protein